ncbi:right-handed parallel beta-helix repeat-containing protein [Candidatus Woesearchaeota archaeon]|nr:right-handed parallel beta-helix repeat-containing protein [Candidatus Woesearchaeota archaeon]
MKKIVWLVVFLAFLTPLLTVSATEVSSCRTIFEDSVLVTNISANRDPCITLGANDITFDCQGYTINGNGIYQGIYVDGKNGVIIKNCRLNNFVSDLKLVNADNNIVEDNIFNDFFSVSLGADNNLVQRNAFNKETWLYGVSNTFDGNTFTLVDSNNAALSIHAGYNVVKNNVFVGSSDGFGIANTQSATYNQYVNNTITNFAQGIILGGFLLGANYNTVANNSLLNNMEGIQVAGGDLNSITGNDINSRNWTEADTTYEGWGVDLGGSRNNVLWDNTIHNQNNRFDVNLNLYCYQGVENTWNFNITPTCEGDCVKPDCSEVLDNQGGWFNGGAGALMNGIGHGPMAEVTGIVPRDDPIITAAWQSINYPDAINGNAHYHLASNSSSYVYWEVHSLLSRYDVYTWKFDHPWSSQMSTTAKYMIKHKYGLTTKYLDQSTPGDQWVYLGRYTFDDSELQGVAIFPSTGGIVAADAVKIVSVS